MVDCTFEFETRPAGHAVKLCASACFAKRNLAHFLAASGRTASR
jgi:hypothetical protein